MLPAAYCVPLTQPGKLQAGAGVGVGFGGGVAVQTKGSQKKVLTVGM
jgi:hypothetical protein